MQSLRRLAAAFKVRHEEVYSRGVKLQVVENDDVRMFKLDGATNSVINKRSIYTGGYWDYLVPLAYACRNPRILLIGLGIGTSIYQLRRLFGNRIRIDAVEIDAKVIALARKYFPGKLRARIIHADGYEYALRAKSRYDIIILDAYWKGALIPKQFFRKEFAENAFRLLNNNGALAINYAMHPSGILHFAGYRKLLKRYFRVYGIKTTALGDTQVILCLKGIDQGELLGKIRKSAPLGRKIPSLIRGYAEMREL